uniref:HECT domain-containing protein n=5 Tax=Iconisemion striatum TaxID=60296 RepID=A0A1A7XIP7_9TELE
MVERPTVQSEMARSFPGFFNRNPKKRGAVFIPKRKLKTAKLWKPFEVCFFLIGSATELTPTLSSELEHFQAGLGKRTLSIESDLSHEELSTLLRETYKKMTELQDRWLIYKAAGGNGRRKLFPVSLESEGYTGAILKTASNGGKNVLFIMPLQDDLDMTPLPADAPEFAQMPKASCKQCNDIMPLQMLVLHVKNCGYSSSSNSEEEDVVLLEGNSTTSGQMASNQQVLEQENEVQCPVCAAMFPAMAIEIHASQCSERMERGSFVEPEAEDTDLDHIASEEDVIRWVKAQIDTSRTFEICVSREAIVERGLRLWKRQKNGGPLNPLKVSFLGEAGVDTGALRVEFLSTMVAGIENRLFEGDGEKGKVPKYSLNDLDNEMFRVAGEIFSVSIAQGGPAPQFMQEWCYKYLVTGKLQTDGFFDTELSPLLKEIEDATDLSPYIQQILDCGYTGPIDIEQKDGILRAVALHATTKRTPMLQQLREGLEVYNMAQVMKDKPDECRSLFVIGNDGKVDSQYIMSHLAPEMSPHGSSKRLKETRILDFFQDFLYELEDSQPQAEVLTVSTVMQWMTGQSHKHLLESERQTFKIKLRFDHNCLDHSPGHTVCFPIVSACTNTVTLPTVHLQDYESFKTNMKTAVKYGASFDRV